MHSNDSLTLRPLEQAPFHFGDCPNAPDALLAAEGWRLLVPDPAVGAFDRQLGEFLIRAGDDGSAQARVMTGSDHRNVVGGVSGGFQAAFAEKSLHLALFVPGRIARGGIVVVDLSINYLGRGTIGIPLISHTWLLRETGRMGFVRGDLRQDGEAIASYTGIVRKMAAPR